MFRFRDLIPVSFALVVRKIESTLTSSISKLCFFVLFTAMTLFLGWNLTNPNRLLITQSNLPSNTATAGFFTPFSSISNPDWSKLLPDSKAYQHHEAFGNYTSNLLLESTNKSNQPNTSCKISPKKTEQWNYLNNKTRHAISDTKASNKWRTIKVHTTGNDVGSAHILETTHQAVLGNSLLYHFVIGNGSQSKDGQIEIGTRWTEQQPSPLSNNSTIHIALVSDEFTTFSQNKSLNELISYLCAQQGHLDAYHQRRVIE